MVKIDKSLTLGTIYVKKEILKGVHPETVIDAMMHKKICQKKIPNWVADPHSYITMEWISSISSNTLDEEEAQAKKQTGESYKRTFLPDRPGKRRGTYRTFMNFLDHNDKGCATGIYCLKTKCAVLLVKTLVMMYVME